MFPLLPFSFNCLLKHGTAARKFPFPAFILECERGPVQIRAALELGFGVGPFDLFVTDFDRFVGDRIILRHVRRQVGFLFFLHVGFDGANEFFRHDTLQQSFVLFLQSVVISLNDRCDRRRIVGRRGLGLFGCFQSGVSGR